MRAACDRRRDRLLRRSADGDGVAAVAPMRMTRHRTIDLFPIARGEGKATGCAAAMGCGEATRCAGGRQRREQKQRSHPRPWRGSRVRQRDGVGEGCEKEKDAYGTDGREERVGMRPPSERRPACVRPTFINPDWRRATVSPERRRRGPDDRPVDRPRIRRLAPAGAVNPHI